MMRAFTLVELPVVMAIIVIMSSLVFGLVSSKSSNASKMVSAGNTLSNLAMVGRQNSLAKNAMTALVMIGNAGTDGDYRAFGLFEVTPRTDGLPASPNDWTQIGAWETFPDGVVIDDSTLTPAATTVAPAFPAFTYRGAAVSDYQYTIFSSNGALLSSETACMRIVSGFRAKGAAVVTYTSTRGSDGKAANYYRVCILPATGRVKIERP
jgi:prepilin-type N-terminal cleavage/methylation domain-containing protein